MESFELVIADLQQKLDKPENQKYYKLLKWYIKAFKALDKKDISPNKFSAVLKSLNQELQFEDFKKAKLEKIKREFITTLEKEHQLIFKGHYQRKYMLYGIIFGVPFGTVFSSILNNYAFVGVGIPIGLAIGIALGVEKDDQAATEGKVLDMDE